MITPVLETKRLILRPLDLRYAQDVQKYFCNWNIIQNMGAAVPWPYPADGAEDFLKNNVSPRLARGECHFWMLTLRDRDECVGVIEFRLKPSEDGNRGFWLAEHLWRQGLMSEAVAAVNDFVFEVLQFDEFVTCNNITNRASSALKKGGTMIGLKEKPGPDGSMHTSEEWRITSEGWASYKANK